METILLLVKPYIAQISIVVGAIFFFWRSTMQAKKKGRSDVIAEIKATTFDSVIKEIKKDQESINEIEKDHEENSSRLPIDWPESGIIELHKENSSAANQTTSIRKVRDKR